MDWNQYQQGQEVPSPEPRVGTQGKRRCQSQIDQQQDLCLPVPETIRSQRGEQKDIPAKDGDGQAHAVRQCPQDSVHSKKTPDQDTDQQKSVPAGNFIVFY